jgi:HSP20 family molecular chaperone IbpA
VCAAEAKSCREVPTYVRLIAEALVPKYFVITRDASGRRNRVRFAALAHDEEKHMSRLSLFNSPLLLGFDHFERALDRVSKISSDGYPPYNIEQLGENALRITLAVAGFAMGDLGITIEDNQLVVRGKQADDPQRVYLHRGIAARQFQRSFVLAEGIEVRGARLDNGLLHIDLVRPEVESRVRTIEITGDPQRSSSAASADAQERTSSTVERIR